jgi:cell division protein FtsB
MSIETDAVNNAVNETHLLVIDYVARLENNVRSANDRIVMLESATKGYDDYVARLEKKVTNLKFINVKYDEYVTKINSRNDFLETEINLLEDKVEECLCDVTRLEKKVEWLKSYNDGLVVENERLNALVQKINELST